MIIDDDADIVRLFEQFLKFKGHSIIAKAFNGEEALEIYRNFENTPNIIIMDHRMPVKNGLDTTKEILAINSNAKIIFISADYTVKEKALEVGAVAFLEKPIDFNTLFNVIEKLSITQSLNV